MSLTVTIRDLLFPLVSTDYLALSDQNSPIWCLRIFLIQPQHCNEYLPNFMDVFWLLDLSLMMMARR